MVNIYIKPDEVWRFFQQNREALRISEAIIAENKETGYVVCLTNEVGKPELTVYRNDHLVCNDGFYVSEDECTDSCRMVIETFLYPLEEETDFPPQDILPVPEPDETPPVSDPEDELPLPPADAEDEAWSKTWDSYHDILSIPADGIEDFPGLSDVMYTRQDEVLMAMKDLLDVLMEGDARLYDDAMADDLVHTLLIAIAEDYGYAVWYPTEYTDADTGRRYLDTYPYNDLCTMRGR